MIGLTVNLNGNDVAGLLKGAIKRLEEHRPPAGSAWAEHAIKGRIAVLTYMLQHTDGALTYQASGHDIATLLDPIGMID